jgi:hypothetical protein
MTKKHFEAFADYIRTADVDNKTREEMTRMVVDVARQFNGRFDSDRFRAASTPMPRARLRGVEQ